MQRSIAKEVRAKGVGIHYNKLTNLVLKPAPENTGIIFKRVDVTNKDNEILASYKNIHSLALSTQIINKAGVFVATIEHLMSAFFAFKINNIIVEVESAEMPIMEGGADEFCFMIECAGLQEQQAKANKFKLVHEVRVGDQEHYIVARPAAERTIKFISDFPSLAIGKQEFTFNIEKDDFIKEISSSKTIANVKEVEMLQKNGMGLGGSLKNTLVYDAESVLNEKCLYNISDFVKHKTLDFIGDLYLAEGSILASFEANKSGHKLNHLLLNEIFKHSSNYQLI